MPSLRPRHWPTPPRPISPFRSRSPRARNASPDGDEADADAAAAPDAEPGAGADADADAAASSRPPSRPSSRAASPTRLLSSPRPRPASPTNPRSKRPLSQHLYQKVAAFTRPTPASDDAPPALEDSYVHVASDPMSSASPLAPQPAAPEPLPFPQAPATADATLCAFFDVVLEHEDEMLNESTHTEGSGSSLSFLHLLD